MVDMKKPAAKPAPDTTAKPAATTTTSRLPALSQLPAANSAAADAPPVAPPATTATPMDASKPASAETQANAAPSPASKPAEVLGKKIRTKAEILTALRKGARVQHTESGLYRIVVADGSVHPASKRRIIALLDQKLLKPTEGDNRAFGLDLEAEAKANEKTSAAKPEAPATAPATEEKK